LQQKDLFGQSVCPLLLIVLSVVVIQARYFRALHVRLDRPQRFPKKESGELLEYNFYMPCTVPVTLPKSLEH